ncbi:bifunctional YncE family protein/alkaline phosphatase family protein [Horticoccus sp. 23ND18S-11]|uniref:bifunctional YncE family protein/alkaline phosphatase family protein n=1 Tax=Horticoccus sp. 23ND18S-11 TaxID=3391832 RepID=UPI0039C94035
MRFPLRSLLIATLVLPALVAATKPPAALPGVQRDGSVLLPNQWSLRPVGKQLPVGDFPVNVALHPGGVFAAVIHSGWGPHEVRILDVKNGRPVSQVALEETFYGLAWSPDGKTLFASGGSQEVVYVFAFKDGLLAAPRELALRPGKEQGVPAGLAVSADGRALYVTETLGQRIGKIAVDDGRWLWTRSLAAASATATTEHEGARVKPSADPDAPFPYTCLPDEKHGRVYVSLWAKAAVLVLHADTGAELARWNVGSHPNEMVLGTDGRLFVAESNLNAVSVIDTATGRITETLTASLYPNSPPGSMPNSLALSPDGELLFVANANNNNVAVFDVETVGKARSLGFIPVGWFPTSVRLARDGRTLVVANGKGLASDANPRGPSPGRTMPRTLQEYIGGLMQGTVSLIELPVEKKRAEQFGAWTKTAYTCSPLDAAAGVRGLAARPAGNPIPASVGEPSPIKHVIYIIRENRTYDQVFGDLPEGNGDPRLCLFPERITPNAHALAREFVLLDNFYADGEVSADGHEWTMGAQATDFVEKIWPLSYGHNARKKYDYPAEGHYPVAFPANGYLWNRAAEAGVSYRSYGEFCDTPKKGPILAEPSLPILVGHIDPYYKAWDLDYSDVKRAERFIAELRRFETEGGMPRLQVLRLGNDHTSGAKAGSWTPTAMVAENDRALGLLVEAVSRSKFWADTAIFVLEDDAQNGPDHVDAHRMPALAISAWTKRRSVDSTLYSTTSMLRTMELILGLQPMSQFDAAAMPLWASFTDRQDLTPFTARPAQVDTDERNQKLAWGGRESEKMDFSAPDRADDIKLNEIVWRSVRGVNSPMPAPVRAAFYKSHQKDDDDKR